MHQIYKEAEGNDKEVNNKLKKKKHTYWANDLSFKKNSGTFEQIFIIRLQVFLISELTWSGLGE